MPGHQLGAPQRSGGTKEWLLCQSVAALAPEFQPDGAASAHRAAEMILRALREGTQRFEWTGRTWNGNELPLEVLLTPVQVGERRLLVVVAREFAQRKEAESRMRQLNLELERRIAERTDELVRANQQLRAGIFELERKERIQRAIYQISEAIHTTDDLDSLYRRIHATIQDLIVARNFYIALYDPGSELFSFPKLGVETRSAATLRALEVLGSPAGQSGNTVATLSPVQR